MPPKRSPQKQAEHINLVLRVEHYDVGVAAGINHNSYSPEFAWDLNEDEPVYDFSAQVIVKGIAIYPDKRANESYELTFYTSDRSAQRLSITLKDIQNRDERGSRQYRQYRGKQIPIYSTPEGLGLLDKVRGEPRWTAWLMVSRKFASDLLIVLGHTKPAFLTLHERKEGRARWVQSVGLQTNDPLEE